MTAPLFVADVRAASEVAGDFLLAGLLLAVPVVGLVQRPDPVTPPFFGVEVPGRGREDVDQLGASWTAPRR